MDKLLLYKKSRKFVLYIILFFINLVFFLPLFVSNIKVITTPEYGGGDENLFFYPFLHFYQQKIRSFQMPFISSQAGMGFPIMAEGEIGVFNPINYLTMMIFPFFTAVNIQIFIYFLILLFSSFYLGKTLKFSNLLSIFIATTISYSFFILTTVIHYSHLASIAYIPLVFTLAVRIFQEERIFRYWIYLIIVVSLQFLSGHVQFFVLSLINVVCFLLIYLYSRKESVTVIVKKFFILISAYVISLLLTSFQLFPSIEYYLLSQRSSKLISSTVSLLSKNALSGFLTFFNPYLLYDHNLKIKSGSLSSFVPPWDGNLFVGILTPAILLLLFKLNVRKNLKKSKLIKPIIALIVIYTLIILGKNSPLYLIYYFPPFSLFRVSERFSIMLILSLTIFLALILKIFIKDNINKKKLVYILVIINIIVNGWLFYNFHLFSDTKEYFRKNQLISYIISTNKRFVSLFFYGQEINRYLFENGIVRKNPIYSDFAKYGLPQNVGLFYKLSSFNLPTSAFNLSRHFLYSYLIQSTDDQEIDFSDLKEVSLSTRLKPLLSYSGIKTITSPYRLLNTQLFLKEKQVILLSDNKTKVYVYNFDKNKDRFQLYSKIKYIQSFSDFKDNLKLKKIEETVLLEEDSPFLKNSLFNNNLKNNLEYKITGDTDNWIKIMTRTNNNGIAVLADTYYPGWHAYVDGKETQIFHANFLFRGIYLPKGQHIVEFRYIPMSFYIGCVISAITGLGLIFILRKKIDSGSSPE